MMNKENAQPNDIPEAALQILNGIFYGPHFVNSLNPDQFGIFCEQENNTTLHIVLNNLHQAQMDNPQIDYVKNLVACFRDFVFPFLKQYQQHRAESMLISIINADGEQCEAITISQNYFNDINTVLQAFPPAIQERGNHGRSDFKVKIIQ